MLIPAALLLPALSGAQRAAPVEQRPFVRTETVHYDLRVQGEPADGERFGKILEAAWPVFRSFFHVEPALPEGGRLAIRIYDSREACQVGALDDGQDPMPSREQAWCSPRNGKVYLHRHESDWGTRYLLLYGACLQFHGLAKPKHRDLDEWYTHGIAESFAVHSFDGEKLDLATDPAIAAVDHPARALAALGGKQIGLDPFTDARLAEPSVRWAVVRFATASSEGRYRSKFEKLALGATGSRVSGHDFMLSLGKERAIAQEFSVWLLSAQMPLEVVEHDWESFPDGRIVATAAEDALAICAAKAQYTSMNLAIDPSPAPGGGMPGILFGFVDDRNYFVARLVPPVVFIEHIIGGRKRAVETLPLESPGGQVFVSIVNQGNRVELEIQDGACGPYEVPRGRLGLAAIEGRVTFREVRCR